MYEIIARKRVTKFYTSPTLARMLMRFGADNAGRYDLSSLKAMFCAGEPLNPEAWHFLYEIVGQPRTPRSAISGGRPNSPRRASAILPTETIRPDRSGKAFGPLQFSVRHADGQRGCRADRGGLLVLETPRAAHVRRRLGRPGALSRSISNVIPGVYAAGDVSTIDDEGYISVLGRADDVLNVAGHRIATADVESALVSHPACGEAGVFGVPDEIKGEAISRTWCCVRGTRRRTTCARELIAHVRHELGPIGDAAAELEIVPKLPKTRSGKIMRARAARATLGIDLGDLTTLDE